MAVEIERKFLVDPDLWQTFKETHQIEGQKFCQGYLSNGGATVRVRIKGDTGWLTIKGKTKGLSRLEYEYPIPLRDAEEMLNQMCGKPLIEKHRYIHKTETGVWEVDEFHGENQGLLIAEIELPSEDASFDKPQWVLADVSHDDRYFNASLAKHPFSQW
ncbi:MAG: CYTH domain-containing protein [Pseudomonadales bacterium]|nr:CYTH domain-containing protein [Pseudomonadales bacterium]